MKDTARVFYFIFYSTGCNIQRNINRYYFFISREFFKIFFYYDSLRTKCKKNDSAARISRGLEVGRFRKIIFGHVTTY